MKRRKKKNASLHYIPHLPEIYQTASYRCKRWIFFSEIKLMLAKTAFYNSAEACCFFV